MMRSKSFCRNKEEEISGLDVKSMKEVKGARPLKLVFLFEHLEKIRKLLCETLRESVVV